MGALESKPGVNILDANLKTVAHQVLDPLTGHGMSVRNLLNKLKHGRGVPPGIISGPIETFCLIFFCQRNDITMVYWEKNKKSIWLPLYFKERFNEMLVIQPPAFVGVTEAGSRKHSSSTGLPATEFQELSLNT